MKNLKLYSALIEMSDIFVRAINLYVCISINLTIGDGISDL